jgi:hypothetical protein
VYGRKRKDWDSAIRAACFFLAHGLFESTPLAEFATHARMSRGIPGSGWVVMQFAQIALRQAGSSPAGVAGGISAARSASCGFTERRRPARERGRHNNSQR